MPAKTLSKMVRNVLANEMQIGGKPLREEVQIILQQVIRDEIRHFVSQHGVVEKMITEVVVTTVFGTSSMDGSQRIIRDAMKKAAYDRMDRELDARLSITLLPEKEKQP